MTTLTRTEMMRDALDKAIEERDSAIKRMDDAESSLKTIGDAHNAQLYRAMDAETRATAAESELFALGVQVQALKERLKLAESAVEAARGYCTRFMPKLVDALAAFDAVPGDVGAVGAPIAVADAVTHRVVTASWPATPTERDMMGKLSEGRFTDDATGQTRAAPPEPDPRPRYASGEVPMVGDVVFITSRVDRKDMTVVRLDDEGDPYATGEDGPFEYPYCARFLTLVRRAAPPTADLLARAVVLLREHAYDQRVIDFLADFDKGGV
jgi:hypothetical protein